MLDTTNAIRISHQRKDRHFEILVHPEYAFRKKEKLNMTQVLFAPNIFKDISSADHASIEDIEIAYDTKNEMEAAEIIFREGKRELTTDQLRKMKEERENQIVNLIRVNAMNPQTNTPHPEQRIRNAMNECKINIDVNHSAEEQVMEIIQQIKIKIPISWEKKRITIKIPERFAGKCYGILRDAGTIEEEDWGSITLRVKLAIAPGMEPDLLNRLNSITHGDIEVNDAE